MCVPQSYEVNTLGGIVIHDAILYFSSSLSDLLVKVILIRAALLLSRMMLELSKSQLAGNFKLHVSVTAMYVNSRVGW